MLIAYIAIDASTLAKVSHCTHVWTNIEACHVVNIQFSRSSGLWFPSSAMVASALCMYAAPLAPW